MATAKDRSTYEFGRKGDKDFLIDALAEHEALQTSGKPLPPICDEFDSALHHIGFFFSFMEGPIDMADATALSDKFAVGAAQARTYLAWVADFVASGRAVDAASNAEAKALLEELMLRWWNWHALSNRIFGAQ